MLKPFHGGNLAWAAAIAHCTAADILDFSASINPLGPPDSAIAALTAAIPTLSHYPDPAYGDLCQALGAHHHLAPDWIFPGNGAAELLTWIGRELATANYAHLITPNFGDYDRALRSFNALVKTHCLPIDSLPNTATSVKTLSIPFLTTGLGGQGLLLNDPHNPTGQRFDRTGIQACLEAGALVVIDEAFIDFLPPMEQQSWAEAVPHWPNLVVLRSLTKFYSLPGLRIGYAIAHPDRIRRWQAWRDPWAVNTLAAAVAIAVLQDHVFQRRTWDWLPPARSQLWQSLAQLPGLQPIPGVANFLLVKTATSATELQDKLLRQFRILIRDGLSFTPLGDRFFRIAVRTTAENQQLVQALAQVLA